MHSFSGTILFVDISGFTPLSARLTAEGSAGVETLSTTLNDYFDKQIQIILHFGGDITKFAGDAVIAVWREEKKTSIEEIGPRTPHLALQAGVLLRDELHDYETDVGVRLSIKSGIGFGDITEYFVGGVNGRWEYLCSGDPLYQVGRCEHQCNKGDIVVSEEIWPHLDDMCEGQVFDDTGDVRVFEITKVSKDVPDVHMTLRNTMRAALASYVPGVVHEHLVRH